MARIHLVGLGAVGAAYGNRLLAAGEEVWVVADAGRAAAYRDQPTVVNGVGHRFRLLVDDPDPRPADLVLVSVKHSQLADAIAELDGSVTDGTVVLSLLNGIASEVELAAAFPQATVLLAVSVGIDAVRVGREVGYTSLGRVVLGEATNPGPRADVVAWVTGVLAGAGIEYEVPADMARELWWKFLVNVGVNQVSAVLHAPYRVFQEPASAARKVMLAAQREVIAIANASGVDLGEDDLERWLGVLSRLGPDSFTSMAQDAMAGRRTEADIFGGAVIDLGDRLGVDVPVNRTLYGLLRAAEPEEGL